MKNTIIILILYLVGFFTTIGIKDIPKTKEHIPDASVNADYIFYKNKKKLKSQMFDIQLYLLTKSIDSIKINENYGIR